MSDRGTMVRLADFVRSWLAGAADRMHGVDGGGLLDLHWWMCGAYGSVAYLS